MIRDCCTPAARVHAWTRGRVRRVQPAGCGCSSAVCSAQAATPCTYTHSHTYLLDRNSTDNTQQSTTRSLTHTAQASGSAQCHRPPTAAGGPEPHPRSHVTRPTYRSNARHARARAHSSALPRDQVREQARFARLCGQRACESQVVPTDASECRAHASSRLRTRGRKERKGSRAGASKSGRGGAGRADRAPVSAAEEEADRRASEAE